LKELSKIDLGLKNFKSPLPHKNGVKNVHDVLRKFVVYYKRKHKNVKKIKKIDYDLKLLSILKTKH